MKRGLVSALVGLVVLWAPAVAAQSVGDIEDELRADGVHVEEGAEGSDAELRRIVADAADSGITLYIVSMAGSTTDAEALAISLRDRVGGTVLVVTPSAIGAASSNLAQSVTNRGLDAFSGTILEGSAAFLAALEANTGDAGSSEAGGGGIPILIVLAVVGGIVVLLVLWTRRRNRARVAEEMATRRAAVTEELADIGREILALEDRVSVADNTDATSHYRKGNEQYLELQEQLDGATSLWQITEVDYAADTAAWHLDATEALLDGDPVPDEPERPDLEVSRPPAQEQPTRPPADRPSRRVEPRQQRRSQWDPPATRGGGFGDVLSGILVGGVLRGGGATGRRAPSRWSGGGSLGGSFGGGLGGGFGGSSGSRSRGSSGSRSR